jgi:hypothetical protein
MLFFSSSLVRVLQAGEHLHMLRQQVSPSIFEYPGLQLKHDSEETVDTRTDIISRAMIDKIGWVSLWSRHHSLWSLSKYTNSLLTPELDGVDLEERPEDASGPP